MQTSSNFFQIEDRAAGADTRIKRGGMGRYDFIIRHHGDNRARVNYWLEADDPRSESLLHLYRFDPPPQNFEINSKGTEYISLIFQVPPYAEVGYYNYTLHLESPKYPGTQAKHIQIQVINAEEDVSGELEPGFWLTPETTSNQLYQLTPGTELNVTVRIENRSRRVDRFFLTCPDLDEDWYRVNYPESARETLGLVQELDGLPLNPDSEGEIQFCIKPPLHALAGDYFPTLQVTSRNQPNLLLLDVVYFQLQVDAGLQLRLMPDLRHIPTESHEFILEVQNTGNIPRTLDLTASDRAQYFKYTIEPDRFQLDPSQLQPARLRVTPRKWWKRPLRGQGIEIPFVFRLEDILVPETASPAAKLTIPDMPQGEILWKARPWWVLWSLTVLPLLLLVSLILAILGTVLLSWLTRPVPVVSQFEPIQLDYQEDVTPPIRLNWKVTNFQQVDRIVITRLEAGVETYRKPFYFKEESPNHDGTKPKEIPTHLRPKSDPSVNPKVNNYCQTDTPPEDPNKKDDPPEIKSFQNKGAGWQIIPSWQDMSKWPKFSEIPFRIPLAPRPKPSTLSCVGIITPAKTAGEYVFQIQVFLKKGGQSPSKEASLMRKVFIKPANEPQIVSFAASQPIYQEIPSMTPINSMTGSAIEGLIRLDWKINHINRVREIKLVSLAPNGTAQGEAKSYIIIQGNPLPPELARFCRFSSDDLVCKGLPTNARKPGDYLFKLTIGTPPQSIGAMKEQSRVSDPVKIQARSLKINKFIVQVNGAESEEPKQIFQVGQAGSILNAVVNWEVEGSEGTKVELLPAPGMVALSGTQALKFAAPGSETLMLRVTSPYGEQQSRTVVLQSIVALEEEPTPIILPPPLGSPTSIGNTGNNNSSGSSNSGNNPILPPAEPPQPSDPNQLEPIEVPPRP
jgi:hypothetical protein